MKRWTVLLLAGSRPGSDPFAQSMGAEHKALVPILGEPMILRPLRALLASDCVKQVRVVTQAPEQIAKSLPRNRRLVVAPSGATIADTVLSICKDPSVQWPVLVTTADHALLNELMIAEFCAAAEEADVAIAVVERDRLLKRLPASKRTWLKFRGGAYTGANLFGLRSAQVAPAIELWRSIEQDRKKGWRLMSLLGPATLVGAALRLLTIDQVLARASRKLGLTLTSVRLSNPLAGVDVDKVEDHALVEAILDGRA